MSELHAPQLNKTSALARQEVCPCDSGQQLGIHGGGSTTDEPSPTNCQNCGRPGAHPVAMHVGGTGYVTMWLCGLADCWQVADKMEDPRGLIAGQ